MVILRGADEDMDRVPHLPRFLRQGGDFDFTSQATTKVNTPALSLQSAQGHDGAPMNLPSYNCVLIGGVPTGNQPRQTTGAFDFLDHKTSHP